MPVLSNPVADVSLNIVNVPQRVIAVDVNGNAMSNINATNQQYGGVALAPNVDITPINAVAVTTTQTGADLVNINGRGVVVVLNMATVGTGSVTLTIQGKDVASGQYYTLLAGAAVVTNSVNVYTVYPAAPATANVSANSPLPRTWRVLATANNANPTTFTVGASVIL